MNPLLNFLLENNNSSNNSSSGSSSSSSSSNSSSNSSSRDDDDHDILFSILTQALLVGRKRHRIENYIEVVHSWTDAEFKEHLRLHRNIVMKLIGML